MVVVDIFVQGQRSDSQAGPVLYTLSDYRDFPIPSGPVRDLWILRVTQREMRKLQSHSQTNYPTTTQPGADVSLTMKMPLPALIRAEFEYVDPQTSQENDYGAYNIYLVTLSPQQRVTLSIPRSFVHPYCRSSLKS